MQLAHRMGETVRSHRKKSGLTQKELAALAEVGVSSIHAIEHGKPTVQLDTLLKVLAVLSIKLTIEGPISGAVDLTAGEGPRAGEVDAR